MKEKTHLGYTALILITQKNSKLLLTFIIIIL